MTLARNIMLSLVTLALAPVAVHAADPDPYGANAARNDIKSTLGFVPAFLGAFPDEAIGGAWWEFKAVQANPKSAIAPKYKELIGLAVSAQIPCDYCVYFHTRAAVANGATEREVKEAVAMAAVVRHWSTWLNGASIDAGQFKKELDQVVANALAPKKGPAAPTAPVTDATTARADIRATLGLVPGFFELFPSEGLAGAWTEFKNFQLNPTTALSPKYKELIGLAVAAQIPCHYCVVFHTAAATKLAGASDAEVREAVAMAAIVRHWSTFLNGIQTDRADFKKEVDRLFPLTKTGAR